MNRIDEIINQVTKKECVVADIGSDHAFVALKLLDKGFVKTIYNVEINEIPLQNSINNTAAYLKTGKVKNVIKGFCTMIIDKMQYQFLHSRVVIRTYIVELFVFAALKYHNRYFCSFNSVYYHLTYVRFGKCIGQEQNAIEFRKIRELEDTVFANIKLLVVGYSAEGCKIGHIKIMASCEVINSLNYAVRIFFINAGYYYGNIPYLHSCIPKTLIDSHQHIKL